MKRHYCKHKLLRLSTTCGRQISQVPCPSGLKLMATVAIPSSAAGSYLPTSHHKEFRSRTHGPFFISSFVHEAIRQNVLVGRRQFRTTPGLCWLFWWRRTGHSFWILNSDFWGETRQMKVCTWAEALFSSEKISDFATVVFSFLFDKYCPIIN